MAIVITNGMHYMKINKKGQLKGTDYNEAEKFNSLEDAKVAYSKLRARNKKFCIYDTESHKVLYRKIDPVTKQQLKDVRDALDKMENKPATCKRKKFTVEERKKIYRKTKGRCYLCGDFVDFNSFEVEHRIPISKGGTNNIKNLYCSCHICNTIKSDIYQEDFNKRINQIFMYQMEKKHKKQLSWKILHRVLIEMV